MTHIITTTQVQQNIGKISADIAEMKTFIVTNHGQGAMVILPYFDGCDEGIVDYLEDYEMSKNKEKLAKRYAKSSKSGRGKIRI